MHDHSIFGALLFVVGGCLVGFSYYISDSTPHGLLTSFVALNVREAMLYLVLGHIIALNGVLLFALGYREFALHRQRSPSKSRGSEE